MKENWHFKKLNKSGVRNYATNPALLPTEIPTYSTKVMVFARSAKAEAKAKSLDKGLSYSMAIELSQKLLDHTFGEVEKSGIPFNWVNETQQQGSSYRERFLASVRKQFSEGVQQLIIIGSDTPNLSSNHLLLAKEYLAHDVSVFGPSADGGVFLIAITKDQFLAGILDQVDWLTDRVLAQLSENASNYVLLDTQADIDSVAEIGASIQTWANRNFAAWVNRAIKAAQPHFDHKSVDSFNRLIAGVSELRGPPQVYP